MVDCYTETAPNFKSSIIHRDVVGPYEMEHDYGLIGGNIFHGELSVEQLFHMRPAPGFADYRTPMHGLYYGSSATHAGGGVCGIPGWQAARAAIRDHRRGRPRARVAPPRAGGDRDLGARLGARLGPDARSHAAAAGAVRAMLEAKSVALLGASPRPGSLGERMVTEATRSSAQPEIHLVNPRYARMFGRPCLPSIDSIEGPVDLVLLGVPDGALEDQLSRAAARGDRSAVIFSGAFNGSGTEALRDRLATQARGAGMALCGAGCMGFVNVVYGLRALGYIERDPLPNGPVALDHPFGLGILGAVTQPARPGVDTRGEQRPGTRHNDSRLPRVRPISARHPCCRPPARDIARPECVSPLPSTVRQDRTWWSWPSPSAGPPAGGPWSRRTRGRWRARTVRGRPSSRRTG